MSTEVLQASASRSSAGHSSGSAAVTVGSLSRLVLPKKQLLVGQKACLPSGDCLPFWKQLPLCNKLPAYRVPEGALELTARRLAQPSYINDRKLVFDLTDPNNHCIDNQYNSLTDPHLKRYFRSGKVKKRLVESGELTPNNRVKSTLKEFNQYRTWLRHVGLLEVHKQQEEERKKEENLKNMECRDVMDIVGVETRLHHERVRLRQAQHQEAHQVRRRTQLFELDRKMEVTSQLREDRNSPDNGLMIERRKQREQVYDKAVKLYNRKTRQMRMNFKQRMKRHDDHVKELEASRVDDSARRVRDEWERRKAYQQLLQVELKHAYQMEADRSLRYRRLFTAEMKKQWQAQADGVRARTHKDRQNRQNYEEGNSRYIAQTFASSPRINPHHYQAALPAPPPPPSENEEVEDEGGASDTNQSEWQLTKDFCQSSLGSPSPGVEGVEGEEGEEEEGEDSPADARPVKIPSFTSIFFDKSLVTSGWDGHGQQNDLAVDGPLNELGLNIRLHSTKAKRSAEEMEKMQKAIARVYRQVSGISLSYIPGMQKPRKGEQRSAMELIAYESSTDIDDEDIDLPVESVQDISALLWKGLTSREREELEDVLTRLMSDLSNGRLEQDDLVRLAACCAFLNETELMEQATSTTSLMPAVTGAEDTDEAGSKKDSDASISSGSIDRFLREAMDRAQEEQDSRDDDYCSRLVDDSIRNTVSRLTRDLHDGSLSREEVREIGSAVASAVVGEVRSDLSVVAEEAMVPTLQHLLREVEKIDEGLLDHTLASLLLTYHQVTRRLDKLVWQVIKDFAVEVMLRTKMALVHDELDTEQFLENLKTCKKTPMQMEMELPRSHELLYVLGTGIQKLQQVEDLCPVMCDLMKIVLDIGRPLLIQRDGTDAFSLPDINSVSLEKIGETACGLEVALEVAATVADGLLRDMQMDRQFEERLRLSLAPSFFVAILASWGEMTATIPKDTASSQTSAKEVPYMPTLGEYVVLIACQRLFNDAANDQLPCAVITHLALHVAEFPGLVSLAAVLDSDEGGRVKLPPYVLRKMQSLSVRMEDQDLGMPEMKKLLAVLLHIYFKEVLMPQGQDPQPRATHRGSQQSEGRWDCAGGPPAVTLVDEAEARAGATFLVRTLATMLLHGVQSEVVMKLDPPHSPDSETDVSMPWEVVQLMSNRGMRELKEQLRKGFAPEHLQDTQLMLLLDVATLREPAADEDNPSSVERFVEQMVRGAERGSAGPQDQPLDEEQQFHAVRAQFRKRLGNMAHDVIKLFAGMEVLHKRAVQTTPPGEKMASFLVTLLLELRQALSDDVLSTDVISEFLQSVASELCGPGLLRDDKGMLVGVIKEMLNDIEWKGSRSRYFARLVANLSQLSLDSNQQSPEVAEGMAATADMLSSLSPTILGQFVQTTLLSLLHAMRGSHTQLRATSEPIETPSIEPHMSDEEEEVEMEVQVMEEATITDIPEPGEPENLGPPQAEGSPEDRACRTEGESLPGDAGYPKDEGQPAEQADDATNVVTKSHNRPPAEEGLGLAKDPESVAKDPESVAKDPESVAKGSEWIAKGLASNPQSRKSSLRTKRFQSYPGSRNASTGSAPSVEVMVLNTQSQAEILHEADIIGHMALQKMLERLGVTMPESQGRSQAFAVSPTSVADSPSLPPSHQSSPCPTSASLTPMPCLAQVEQMVNTMVGDFDHVALSDRLGPKRDFTGLRPAMAHYAQQLMQHVAEYFGTLQDEDEEGGSKVKSEDMAAIIISNTLKSLQDTGTHGITPQPTASDNQLEVKPSVDVPNLKDCIATTLTAVGSELHERHANVSSQQGDSEGQPTSSTPTGHSPTLQRANQIVDFILERVDKLPPWEDKQQVEISVDRGSPSRASSENKVAFGRNHSAVLSDTILQTLLDVVHEMQEQNQFFSQSAAVQDEPEDTDTVMLPGLPFLLDDFILCHLDHMAMLLTRQVPGMESPNNMLSAEAYKVATNFHATLNDTLKAARAKEDEAGQESKNAGRKLFVLTVLDKAITRLLDESLSMGPIEETEEVSGRRASAEPAIVIPDRTSVEVKSDLQKLFSSLGNMRRVSGPKPEPVKDMPAEKEIVTKAVMQIMESLEDDKVTDEVLDDLCQTLLPHPPEVDSRDGKRAGLLTELRLIVDVVQSDQISAVKLAQTAADIHALEDYHVADPRRVAGAVQQVSSSLRGSNMQYLKVALEDLLFGLGTRPSASYGSAHEQEVADGPEPATLPTEVSDEEHGGIGSGGRNSSDSKLGETCKSQLQEDNQCASGAPPFRSNISTRTISKIKVNDLGRNREKANSLIYPSLVRFYSPSTATDQPQDGSERPRRQSAPVVITQGLNIKGFELPVQHESPGWSSATEVNESEHAKEGEGSGHTERDSSCNRTDDDPPGRDNVIAGPDPDPCPSSHPLPGMSSAHENLCEENTVARVNVKSKGSRDETMSDTAVDGSTFRRCTVTTSRGGRQDGDDERAHSDSHTFLPAVWDTSHVLGMRKVSPSYAPDHLDKPSTLAALPKISGRASTSVDIRTFQRPDQEATASGIPGKAGKESPGPSSEDATRTLSSSVEPPTEDWNRSAIQIRSDHYVRDSFNEDEPSGQDPGIVRGQTGLADFELMTKRKVPKHSSKKPINPTTYSRQLLSRSQAFVMATYSQNLLGPKKELRMNQKPKGNLKSSVQRENCSEVNGPHVEPTTAVQQYGDRPHLQTSETTQQSVRPREIAAGKSDSAKVLSEQGKSSATKQKHISASLSKNIPKGDTLKIKTDPSADVNLESHEKHKGGKESNQPKTVKQSEEQDGVAGDCGPTSRRRLTHRDRILRAQKKAFSLGLSLYNAGEKEKWIQRPKRADTQYVRHMLAGAMADAGVTVPPSPAHPPHSVTRLPGPSPQGVDSWCSQTAHRAAMAASPRGPFVPRPPLRNETGMACSTEDNWNLMQNRHLSKRRRIATKRQSGMAEVPDTGAYPIPPSEQTKSRDRGRATDHARGAPQVSAPVSKPKRRPEGRFLRKLMEWNSEPASPGAATHVNEFELNNTMETPETSHIPSLDKTDCEQLLEGSPKQPDNWPERPPEAPCSPSEEYPASASLVPLHTDSPRQVAPDVRHKTASDKLPALPQSGSRSLAARAPPPARRSVQHAPRPISSQTLPQKLPERRVRRSQRDQRNNATADSRLQPLTQPSPAVESGQGTPGGCDHVPQAPDPERTQQASARRRVRLLLGDSLQIPGVPKPALPRPPDNKPQ